MNKIKIGIIGTGNVYRYYKEAIKNHGLFVVSGVFDQRKNNFNTHTSVNDLLSSKPNIVAILTSSSSRYKIAKKILAKKIPVILEKPPTETMEQFDDLTRLSMKNKTFIFGALHSRYTTTHTFVRNNMCITKKGTFHSEFGKLKQIELNRFDPYVKRGKLQNNLPEKTSGLDSWPNILAELSLFVDSYKISKIFNLNNSFSPRSVEVKSELNGKISGGGIFVGNTDWTQSINQKITILNFTKGTIIMDHTLQKVFIKCGQKKKEIGDFSHVGDRMMIEYFYMFNEIYSIYHKLIDSNEIVTRKILFDTLYCFKKMKGI